jgi:MFS transporter, CP family, cyanate transporter
VGLAAGWLVLSRGTWTERSATSAPRLPVRRGVVWGIVAVFGLQSAIFYAFVSWMPDAFQERGWSAAAAGALPAVFGLAALPTGLLVPWLADRAGSRRLWLTGASAVTVVGMLGLAALPGAAFAWATIAGAAIGAVFPLSLTLCLDVAHGPAEAGAVAALVLLGGYILSSLSPVGLGALRDATGSFSPVLWTMFGAAVLLLACCVPLTADRLRPV